MYIKTAYNRSDTVGHGYGHGTATGAGKNRKNFKGVSFSDIR
jgi:hypothetical protein